MATIGTTNVTMATIRDTLNGAGGSVTNDLTSFFKSSARLNMWSKFKPVVHATLFFDLATWQSSGWKGSDGKCGLTIPTYIPSTFKTAVQGGTNVMWGYTPPTGGTTQPMRLGDFRGYHTDAYNPIGNVVTNGLINTNGTVTFAIDVAITGTSSTNLLLTDITINDIPLSNYYLGVFLWSSNVSRFYTSSNRIGSGANLNVSIPLSTSMGGTYKYIMFLSSAPQTTGSDVTATIISCNKPVQEVKITTASTMRKITPIGTWNAGKTGVVNIKAYLDNLTSSSVTFTNIRVALRRSTGTNNAASELVTTVAYTGSVTVAAQGSATISIPNITHTKASGYNYWLAAYADQTTETTYMEIEEVSG